MSDTMRDAAWKLVPVEPTEQMIEAGRHVKRMRLLDSVKAIREGRDPDELMGKTAGAEYRAMLDAAPAPPVPSSVQDVLRLMGPYVRASLDFATAFPDGELEGADAACTEAFKPLQAALTALVDERDRLKFELAGVRAMRRPEWQPIETAPKDGEFLVYMPNERAKIQAARWHPNVKTIGGNFAFDLTKPTHWQPMPSPPTLGIEPEQGGNHG